MVTGEFSNVKLLAGSFGVTGYADGTGTSAKFNEPSQGDVDEDGNCSFEITPIRIKDGYPEVTNNAFFKKRTYRTLTKNLKDSDYEVKSNTLLMKNAIKIDLNKNNQTDANADNTDVSNDINTTSDVNNTDNNTTTKTNTQY